MSVPGLERSHTGPSKEFDHSINLVDATTTTDGANDDVPSSPDSESATKVDSNTPLSRQRTKASLRKQLATRKYAKYRRESEDGGDVEPRPETVDEENGPESSATSTGQKIKRKQTRLREKVPFRSQKTHHHHHHHRPGDNTFIDVLYENQRGMFLCGIPLYSANSLLNFDPAEWQNASFQDSPVDIRDAQLPDPSWRWAWRTWYVDMSHDVDESGWEYSFTFGSKFSWHGNHPWFHSFVRRRRWLRKRVKVHGVLSEKRESRGFREAHKLNTDYFTIHAAKRDRSRDSSGDRTVTLRSSAVNSLWDETDDDDAFEEISDISTLLTAIKKARVDREKIMSVYRFVKQAGDEVVYLAENINPIMDDLVHQTSRRQLQHYLLRALDEATKACDSPDSDSEEKEAQKCKVDNLIKAVDATGIHVNDQDYWSDLKARTQAKDSASPIDQTDHLDADRSVDIASKDEAREHIEAEGDVGDEIKGISEEAEVSVAPRIRRPGTEMEMEKEKEKEGNDDGDDDDKQKADDAEEEQERKTRGEEEGQVKSVDKGKGKEIA